MVVRCGEALNDRRSIGEGFGVASMDTGAAVRAALWSGEGALGSADCLLDPVAAGLTSLLTLGAKA